LKSAEKVKDFLRNALHYHTGHNFVVPTGWTKDSRLGTNEWRGSCTGLPVNSAANFYERHYTLPVMVRIS